MKLEHKSQRVVSLPRFALRLSRYGLFIAGLIVFSVALGTIGYKVLAGLSWVDSFYMACMILTGMGPVVTMETDAAKLFSSFYALYSGLLFVSTIAIFFTPIIHRLLHILHVETGEDKEG